MRCGDESHSFDFASLRQTLGFPECFFDPASHSCPRPGVRGWHDQGRRRDGNSVDQGIMPGKEEGEEGLSLVRSLGANDANLPCKSRHISRHRAVEGRSREPTLRHPFCLFGSLALLCRYHAPFCRSAGGGWKVFPSCYPGSYHAARQRRVENSTM